MHEKKEVCVLQIFCRQNFISYGEFKKNIYLNLNFKLFTILILKKYMTKEVCE